MIFLLDKRTYFIYLHIVYTADGSIDIVKQIEGFIEKNF